MYRTVLSWLLLHRSSGVKSPLKVYMQLCHLKSLLDTLKEFHTQVFLITNVLIFLDWSDLVPFIKIINASYPVSCLSTTIYTLSFDAPDPFTVFNSFVKSSRREKTILQPVKI